jgi:glycosyltransferase involved in cell wall biosynthesis
MICISKNVVPFFSVIITTYNRKNIVKKAINSVLNQTEQDFELIIVDDGSQDNTYDDLKNIVNENDNLSYIYQKNKGAASAKNKGILATSGIFVTFLDSDDEFKPNHLEIRKDILFDNDDIDLLHGGVEIAGNKFVPDINDNDKLVNLENCIIGGTFFARKETLIEVGGFPITDYGEDRLLYEKFKKKKMTIAKVLFPTYIYNRNSNDSICKKITDKNEEVC